MRPRLGVNIDHIATLRAVRGVRYPAPLEALTILKKCRVDQVTLHLREDRRHIVDADLKKIVAEKVLPVNLEMAATPEMLQIALRTRPHTVTYVPEKRRELTTEGGLDAARMLTRLKNHIEKLQRHQIRVSLFIEARSAQIRAAKASGADGVEFHTGCYCDFLEKHQAQSGSYSGWQKGKWGSQITRELEHLRTGIALARALGLHVYAGHGLHVGNLAPIVALGDIEEYNIGHAIIARAVFVGLKQAIREIQACLS